MDSINIFDIAKQIATPEYVSMRVEGQRLLITNDGIALIVLVSIIGVCLIAMTIVKLLESKNKLMIVDAYCVLGIVAVIAAIIGAILLISFLVAQAHLVDWETDPVTKIATKLMDAI